MERTYVDMWNVLISVKLEKAFLKWLASQCICCAQSEPKTNCPIFCAGVVEQVRGIYL